LSAEKASIILNPEVIAIDQDDLGIAGAVLCAAVLCCAVLCCVESYVVI
jgi:hypothetical protein